MTDSNVRLPPDSSGKRLDTRQLTQGGGDVVQREVVSVGDPSDVDQVAEVSSNGLASNVGDANVISTANSSTTPLAGSATYTGTGEEVVRYSSISVSMYATPSTADGTLYFEFSTDNTNWDVSIPVAVANPTIQVPLPLRTVARYFRVRYVNGTTVQTAFRLQTILHRWYPGSLVRALDTQILTTEPVSVTRSVLTGLDVNDTFQNIGATPDGGLVVTDFLSEVAQGNIPGRSMVTKFGRNSLINTATTPEDVWEGGGLYTGQPLTTLETVQVFSSAAADTSAGTGARTVVIQGLDGSYALQSETITLSGTTPVASANSYRRVFRAWVATAGSGATNAGQITIRHSTTTANIFAQIAAGYAQSTLAAYTVPAGMTAYLQRLNVLMARTSGAAGAATVSFRSRETGGVFRARRIWEITNSTTVDLNLNSELTFPAQTDLRVRVDVVSDNSSIVTAAFALMLVTD